MLLTLALTARADWPSEVVPGPAGVTALGAGDVDRDGDADLALAGEPAPTMSLAPNEGGVFGEVRPLPRLDDRRGEAARLADLDGDGVLDWLCGWYGDPPAVSWRA